MGGAGIVGSGGIGVGGWQIYEGVNPTLYRQLSKEGLTWTPIEVDPNEQISNEANKYNWKDGSCIRKLFPGLSIKHQDPDSSATTTATHLEKTSTDNGVNQRTYYFKQEPSKDVSNDLLGCALLDLREGTNKVYFKSEVVVKDVDRGWALWNGLSTTSDNKVVFEYRFLLFEKETNNESWQIKTGWGWDSPTNSNNSSLKNLVIKLPEGQYWNYEGKNVGYGKGYSTRKTWSGIAKLDNSSNKHMVHSMDIYMSTGNLSPNQRAEFFGIDDGKWHESNTGYQNANKTYEVNSGWKTLTASIQLGDSIEEWYKPYKEKYVKWMSCDQWSSSRRAISSTDSWDKTMKEMCFSSTSN